MSGLVGGWVRRMGLLAWVAPVLWWSSCATGPEGSMAPEVAEPMDVQTVVPAESRPGLATGYGDEVREPMRRSGFVRSTKGAAGTDQVYYNDRRGIDAMTSYKYRTGGLRQAAGGMVEWGIKSGLGYATTYESGGKRFVLGSPGRPYTIVVKNRCRSRVEVVLSVDGLDVMDGKSATLTKRGYLIRPGDTLEVKGWRSGWDTVARFEFSSVGASYASRRHGDTRNVGVIGLAVFGEKDVDPWKWMPDEVQRRRDATPFAVAP